MTSRIFLELGVLFLLLLLNGMFAMAELAIVSARRERLRVMADAGDAGAVVALSMAEEPTALLSTAQVFITLIGILAGAFGGATLTEELGRLFAPLPVIGPYGEVTALVIVVAVITFFSVVLGELVPKRLALRSPENIAARLARPMHTLSRLTRPAVRLLSLATALLLRLLGAPDKAAEETVSEDEIRLLIAQGAESGIFESAERDMVESIFRFGDSQLRSLMTPRTEIVWLDVADSEDEVHAVVRQSHHARFPLCEGTLDRVVGIVHAKDVLAETWRERPFDLRVLAQPPLYLPETMLALRALEKFKQTGIQAALLVDEFGGIEGMVTIIDMMEAIVGDIPSLDEIAEPPIVRREDGSYLVEGYLSVDDLKELLAVGALPDEGDYQTLGGFVVVRAGRLPRVGDAFTWNAFRFEVMDMDGNRVDKVLISRSVGQ